MTYPYYISTINKQARLYQLKDGRFQLIERSRISPFMYGYGYLLIEKALVAFLQKQEIEGVKFNKCVILDKKNNIEYSSHDQVVLDHHFHSDQINKIDISGNRLLVMDNEYIFATPQLKECLVNSEFKYFTFSYGLSKFAG